MTYEQTMQWLLAKLPMFQRVGAMAYKADLSNIIKFCNHLGNPQNDFKTIHVAGTNGKGSTSHMMASVLMEAGYKTGLHTSPHLKHFGERSRINGANTDEEFIIDFIENNESFIESNSFSFFEVAVALGFKYFAENKVDVAVIETGLGGRLDSTNIIRPELSVITNIGKDHTAILGDSLEKIATEKAGIIKPGIPVVIGEYLPETREVFMLKAQQEKAPIYFASDEFVKNNNSLELEEFMGAETDLKGIYQVKNKKTAVVALKILQQKGWKITNENITEGLLKVAKNTGLRGRWDILGQKPLIVADTAHNPDGIQQVIRQIQQTDFKKLHLVLGFVSDKDVKSIIAEFPSNAEYYFSAPDVPRKMKVEDLKNFIPTHLNARFFDSIPAALKAAQNAAENEDMIYIGGSTFVVGEVI